MADVINQSTPPTIVESRGGGGGAVMAVIVVVLLLVVAWFVFGGRITQNKTTKVDINVPAQSSGTPPSGGTKTP